MVNNILIILYQIYSTLLNNQCHQHQIIYYTPTMLDHYVRMADELPNVPSFKFLLAGYISQAILYCLIITYCILSPSLFSTISLAFMLISFMATIATPYYLIKTDQSKQSTKVVAYPVQRIIWIIFMIYNLAVLGFKLYILITGSSTDYSQPQQQFLQIQNQLSMFLPLIMLPFIGTACLIRTKNRSITQYKTRPNNAITVPIFLAMGILIICIQIFSLSLAGFCFFMCVLALFVQRKLQFNNIWSQILVLIVNLLCFGFIVANFIATTSLIQEMEGGQIYRFYGIDALNNFMEFSTSQGYIICLILEFILTALIQKIFIYYRIWKVASDVLELGEIKQEDIFRDQGVIVQSDADHPQSDDFEPQQIKKYEMQSVRESGQPAIEQPRRYQSMAFNLKGEQFKISESIMLEDKQKQLEIKRKKKSMGQKILDGFLYGINKFVEFIYSTEFCLRATQILSIVVIQRYNNIYSFVAVLWLATVASVQKIKVIFYITSLILLPVQLTNFIILYWFNAPESPLSNYSNLQIYGFQTMQLFWLDILIFNLYFLYIVTYLLSASRDSRQTFHDTSQKKPEVSYWVLFLAFIFRYTYLFTIAAIFFLGFSVVNLINFVYVVMFLVFFSSGENVIAQKKMRGNKQMIKLTTFSRKYWFIIVYYTLICVITKYTYFLFFNGQSTQQLQPTGINYIYNWSFNFSLSSICYSNTTPFFIIFLLSESQIIIYRSSIYLNYSFALMNQVGQTGKTKKGKKKMLNLIIEFVLQFYYQSLYYVSGLIILICSYRWDINGLIIICLVCWALVFGFSKKILAGIVFLDLGFLIANYVVLFANYTVVANFLGDGLVDVIEKVSLLLGLKIGSITGLTNVFALSIIIFYFSVQSYRLFKIIQQDRFDQQGKLTANKSSQQQQLQQSQPQQYNNDDILSQYQPTILQSQFQDIEFAKNFNKGVIIATKKLYGTCLWKKYKIWNYVCNFLAVFMVDIIAIVVIVCCLEFRVSVSMLYYLVTYMLFYFNLFDDVGRYMEQVGFYDKIFVEIDKFKMKEEVLLARDRPRAIINGEQSTESLMNFIEDTRFQAVQKKFYWKQRIWKLSSFFSAMCLILAYSSQFITCQFYTTYLNFSWTLTLQQILFVLGLQVSSDQSYARQTYFYYLMITLSIIEMLLLRYIKQTKEQAESSEHTKKKSVNYQIYTQLFDPEQFIDIQCDIIQQIELQQQFQIQAEPIRKNSKLIAQQNQDDYAKQANLLIYFNYKRTLININLIYGSMMVLLRFYTLMMMINLYEQSNIFSFAYLITVLYFWFQPVTFQMVKNINKAAIIILLLQYIMLLLDIDAQISPLPLPDNQSLSLLQALIKDQAWINYLLFNFDSDSFRTFLAAFFISSIIIFLTEFYFTVFFIVSTSIVGHIKGIYQRYQYIQQNLQEMPEHDTIYLNYQGFKSWKYRFLNLSYELVINNSYIFVAILILILLSGVHTYLAVGLVFFACVYIYLGIFTTFSQDTRVYSYTSIFFKIIRIILFLILIIATIAQIPIFNQQSQIIRNLAQLVNISQIFLLFFIQIWLDLYNTVQFRQATTGYNKRVKNRENVLIKCLAYQENQDFIRRLIQRYKEIMWFQVNLSDALNIIDQWHKSMYREKIPEFQNIKADLAPLPMDDLRQEIKQELSRRPEQDDSIRLRFKQYMDEHINVTIKYRYYEIMKFIVFSNHRVIDLENQNIDIWDYVLENYEKLNSQIEEAEKQLDTIVKAVQSEEEGSRMNRIQEIKKNNYSSETQNLDEQLIGRIQTPEKIFLDIKPIPDSFSKTCTDFFLSNFSYFLSFFIWIYYMINPCLLSLPLIVYLFSYQIMSNHKLTSLMLLYIFTIIIFALLVQLDVFSSAGWVQYFFLRSGDSYVFAVGYLYFIFILIFINQQLKKYQGNKFKYVFQAENTLQGALRILINVDQDQKINLWKMQTHQNYEEKQCNPMNYFADQIQKHPEKLTDCSPPSFFGEMSEGKTGRDFYPFIASVQIFITIYLIFLYPFMVQSSATTLAQSFKYFQFSSDMVLAVLANVTSIVIQRWITLIRDDTSRKLKIKYYYTMTLLGLFLWFIYYLAPYSSIVNNYYYPQPALIAFSFFFFLYFFLSGLQIRFGYKKYKSLNSIMTRRRQLNNYLLIGFTNIPFLYELKISMDWSFCDTSLKIFDWFRLFSIYYSAFKAKMQYYSSTGVTLGQPMSWIMKSLGWITFIGILAIIFLPMVLFSGLNPIAQTNLVTSGSLSLGIQIVNGNFFGLYATSHFAFPPLSYDQQTFTNSPANFTQVPLLQSLTSNDIPQQFQFVQFQPFSDTNWGISNPNLDSLLDKMSRTINQMQNNKTVVSNFQIVVNYQLTRRVATTIAEDNKFYYPYSTDNNVYLNLTQLQDLYKTFTTCNQPAYLPNFYIDLIRLNTVGDTYKPRPINYTSTDGKNLYLQGIYLTLYCNQLNSTAQTNDVFWGVNTTNATSSTPNNPTRNGLNLNVYCDKYQNLIGGLGFTALYTSVILVVANLIRGAFQANLPQIPYFQNPKPDNIIQISQAIGTLRSRRQFREQYLMYYQLIDIIRSPDMMKYLSGSFPAIIQQADAKRQRKQQEKRMQQLKNKID